MGTIRGFARDNEAKSQSVYHSIRPTDYLCFYPLLPARPPERENRAGVGYVKNDALNLRHCSSFPFWLSSTRLPDQPFRHGHSSRGRLPSGSGQSLSPPRLASRVAHICAMCTWFSWLETRQSRCRNRL